MEQLVGRTLGRYRIDALLGEGGMGAVFRARDVTLERDVALKVMHPHIARRSQFRERFLQEARVAARLDHPGIVQVHDFGQEGEHLYIVMEFIPGDNLKDLLEDLSEARRWIVLQEAIELIRQVSVALDFAHDAGILHRDIKPGNIMLKPRPSGELPYTPVVTDLGLAKLAEGGVMTAEGTSMGTPAYMSPEQASGQPTDARSDVYSLGVLLYELAVGQLPFPIRTITEAIRYHTQEPPPPPRSRNPHLPPTIEAVILRALAKRPAERYADAGDLAQALEGVTAEASRSAAPPPTVAAAVSLVTPLQQSLVASRGPSVLADFPLPPTAAGPPRVTVRYPDGRTAIAPFRTGEAGLWQISVGRGGSNDLVLEERQASRNHARIQWDGQRALVTDLGSTNGTFLGNTKLLPGVAQAWDPGAALRIGASWLRFEPPAADQAGPAPSEFPVAPDLSFPQAGAVPEGTLHRRAGTGRVGLFLDRSDLPVLPGQIVTASLTILNQGPVVDSFQTTVEGVPAGWLASAPPTVRLMPGTSGAVPITFAPPREAGTRAGSYRLVFRTASIDVPDEVSQAAATLTVGAYEGFHSELHPQRIRAGREAHLSVRNEGNAPQRFQLSWKDRADELLFEPPQMELAVEAGQSASVPFRALARHRRWVGGRKTHRISARVAAASGESQVHDGEVVSSGLIPAWLLAALVVLLAAIPAGILLFGRDGTPPPPPVTPTTEPTPGAKPTAEDVVTPTEPSEIIPATEPIVATFLWAQEFESLNPMYSASWYSAVTEQIWNCEPWDWDETGVPHPVLVTEMPSIANGGMSRNGLTLVLSLRDGIVWSDGTPITSDDFVFTYQMFTDPANSVVATYPYDLFVSVKAIDDRTVQIGFSEPFGAWMATLYSELLPAHILRPVYEAEGTLDRAAWNNAPTVGCGPYVFAEWEAGSYARFVRNDNYYDDPAKIDEIVIRFVPDGRTRVASMQAGVAELASHLSYTDIAALEAAGFDITMVERGSNEGWYFYFGEDGEPALQDLRVRQAIAMCYDRFSLVDELFLGRAEVPASFWHNTSWQLPGLEPLPYDVEKAQALLDEAGVVDSDGDGYREYVDGSRLVLVHGTTTGTDRGFQQEVARKELARCGIRLDTYSFEAGTLTSEGLSPCASGDLDICEWAGNSSYPDPGTRQWLISEIPGGGSPDGVNQQHLNDPYLDELFQLQSILVDPGERQEIFYEISQYMAEQVIWLGLWHDPIIFATSSRLKNVRLSGATPFSNIAEWEVDEP